MKMSFDNVLFWFCHRCGYGWPVRDEKKVPRRCGLCRCSDWQAERDDDAEC